MKELSILGDNRFEAYTKTRAVIVEGENILLSHDTKAARTPSQQKTGFSCAFVIVQSSHSSTS